MFEYSIIFMHSILKNFIVRMMILKFDEMAQRSVKHETLNQGLYYLGSYLKLIIWSDSFAFTCQNDQLICLFCNLLCLILPFRLLDLFNYNVFCIRGNTAPEIGPIQFIHCMEVSYNCLCCMQ